LLYKGIPIINSNHKSYNLLIAILVAILTTGFLRIHWITFLPEPDGGLYTFFSQYFFSRLANGELIEPGYPIALYSFLTSWVYGLEINQYIALRWIDLCLAVTASILFFKVIEKESGNLIFSIVTVSALLLVMHNYSFNFYGFRNSIWAAYVPLFFALYLSQTIKNKNHYLFYFIGAMAAFGVLLREPFIFFYIVGTIAIFLNYGLKSLVKYLIGSAVLGFSILTIMTILREESNPITIFHAYINYFQAGQALADELLLKYFFKHSLIAIKAYWFGIAISLISASYILKLKLKDRKSVSTNRFFFWLALAIVPIIEPLTKLGFDYHFLNCIPGLAGITAMGWKYINQNESIITKNYFLGFITIICILGVYPNLYRTLNINVYNEKNSISDAYNQLWRDQYSQIETIRLSNFLIAADMIKKLSRKDSTLATAGYAYSLYPLTRLLPTSFATIDLRTAFQILNWNEDKLVSLLKKEQPTIIFPTKQRLIGIPNLTRAIQRTGLYERVAIISDNPNVYYKSIVGDIYRLKSFNQ
tara:strand:- start:50 stop:1642 length:1593 start_codon:yes stop_codon:yes gene_type:complete